MEKINNWENIEIKGIEDFKRIQAGGYVCVIKNVEEYISEKTNNKSLKVEVDIIEGEFKDYFQKSYNNDILLERKWDNNSTKYVGLEEKSLPFFKGFITCIENSNTGYKWDWNEKGLIGKKIGGVYQWEEYEKQDRSRGIKARLTQFRSTDKVHKANTDNIKLLNGTYMSYDDYMEKRIDIVSQANEIFGNDNISVEDLPFEL